MLRQLSCFLSRGMCRSELPVSNYYSSHVYSYFSCVLSIVFFYYDYNSSIPHFLSHLLFSCLVFSSLLFSTTLFSSLVFSSILFSSLLLSFFLISLDPQTCGHVPIIQDVSLVGNHPQQLDFYFDALCVLTHIAKIVEGVTKR